MITFNNFVTKHCYRPFRFLVYVLYASRSLHFANSLLATIYTHTFHSSTRPFFYITFILKLCVSILSILFRLFVFLIFFSLFSLIFVRQTIADYIFILQFILLHRTRHNIFCVCVRVLQMNRCHLHRHYSRGRALILRHQQTNKNNI